MLNYPTQLRFIFAAKSTRGFRTRFKCPTDHHPVCIGKMMIGSLSCYTTHNVTAHVHCMTGIFAVGCYETSSKNIPTEHQFTSLFRQMKVKFVIKYIVYDMTNTIAIFYKYNVYMNIPEKPL